MFPFSSLEPTMAYYKTWRIRRDNITINARKIYFFAGKVLILKSLGETVKG